MAPALHEAFQLHCSYYERVKEKSNTCKWQCKYCPKIQTSSVTRLLIHICKLGGDATPCKGIPDDIFQDCCRKYLPLKRRKGIARASEEVVAPDFNASDADEEVSPSISISSGSAMAGSSRKSHSSGAPTPNKRQATLVQATGGLSGPISFLKERQRLADIEIARTIIECNLSFHVLKCDRWKKMVKTIAAVGPCEGWYGVTYHDMRTKKLDEERERIDKSLEPVRAGWAKYGCSILSDGWSDRKKRGIINILVSCPLGTYFLRGVDAGVKGTRTTGSFIYRHIRQAIQEVRHKCIM